MKRLFLNYIFLFFCFGRLCERQKHCFKKYDEHTKSTAKCNSMPCCVFFISISVGLIGANVIVPHTVDCECSNTEEHSHEECINNVAHCSSSESDKASSCFVLWATNNTTGSLHIYKIQCQIREINRNRVCV